jgi:hypothetical protein
VDDLALAKGDDVLAIIKASDVMVANDTGPRGNDRPPAGGHRTGCRLG